MDAEERRRAWVLLMRVRPLAVAAISIGWLTVGAASAASITGKSSCASLAKAVDTRDQEQITDIKLLIENLLDRLDRVHVENGEFSVLTPLSDAGLINLVAMVDVNCRNHPKETIEGSAGDIYRGVRDLRRGITGE